MVVKVVFFVNWMSFRIVFGIVSKLSEIRNGVQVISFVCGDLFVFESSNIRLECLLHVLDFLLVPMLLLLLDSLSIR